MNKVSKHIKYENGKPVPKWIRCYETKKGDFVDPYTVVFSKASCWNGKEATGRIFYLGMSKYPCRPTGVGQHGEAYAYDHPSFGSKVKFYSLPNEVRELVIREYQDIWDVKFPVEIKNEMIREAA